MNQVEEQEQEEQQAETEYTVQTEDTSFMDDGTQTLTLTSNKTYSYTTTYSDNDKVSEHSRITHNSAQKKITIDSDVLDADIMDDLYDNKIKPLGISGKIAALKAQIDYNSSDDSSSSSNVPSPKSLSNRNHQQTESTNLYYGYNNEFVG